MQSWEAPGGRRVSSRLIYPRQFVWWGALFKIPPGQWDKRKSRSDLSGSNSCSIFTSRLSFSNNNNKTEASLCIFSGRWLHPVYHSASRHRHTSLSVCHLQGCVAAIRVSGQSSVKELRPSYSNSSFSRSLPPQNFFSTSAGGAASLMQSEPLQFTSKGKSQALQTATLQIVDLLKARNFLSTK